MDKQKLWGILKVVFKIAFTVVLIYLVFQKIDIQKLKTILLKSNPFYIFLALVVFFISQLVASWRLLTFLKNIGLTVSYGFNTRLYLLGMFYNTVLPGGVGGDGYKIYLLRKKFQLPTKRILLALLFDRLSGLWAIGFITVALIIFIPKIEIPSSWPIIALVTGTAVYYFVMRKFFTDYSKNFLITHAKAGLVQSMQVLCIISILFSQNFSDKFSPYLFSFQLSTLAANVPIGLPGGIGIREYTMIHAAQYFGMNETLAVFLSSTFWMISTLVSLAGIWFVYNGKEFAPLPSSKEAKEFEEESDKAIESPDKPA